jgi:hypothetical protein
MTASMIFPIVRKELLESFGKNGESITSVEWIEEVLTTWLLKKESVIQKSYE